MWPAVMKAANSLFCVKGAFFIMLYYKVYVLVLIGVHEFLVFFLYDTNNPGN